MTTARSFAARRHLVCLCAAWCRLCEGYAAMVHAVASRFQAEVAPLDVHWIDVEDDAELVGDLDVETFPTIVVCDGTKVLFAGPVPPHADNLMRLLRARLCDDADGWRDRAVSPEVQAFVDRLSRHPALHRA